MTEDLKIIIAAEVSKLQQGVDNAKQHIKGFQEQVKKASADVDAKFAAIGDSMKTAATNIGIGIGAAAGALLALAGSTEDYRNQQAQLITAFEESGTSAEVAKGVWNDLYRVLGDTGQAQEAAQHLAQLGVDAEALSEYTTICQGVYSQFGASLPIEGLTEAINHTTNLGEVQGVLSDALEWSGISTDEFNKKLAACNTEAEREQLIRETLNGLYADAAATYEENNAQVLAQRDAQMALQEKLAALGESLSPVITAFTSFATDALALVVPYIQQLADQYLPLLQDGLAIASETMGTVFQLLTDNWDTVLTVAAVIGGIAAAIGLYNIAAGIKAAMAALEVTTVWGLVAAYAAQAAAMALAIAPYVLVVAAIAAVVAAILWCIDNWDLIKETAAAVWEAMSEKITEIAGKIKEKIEEMITAVSEKFTAIKETITGAMDTAKENVKETLSNMKSAYEEHGGGIKGVAAAAMEGVKGYYKTGFNTLDSLTGGKLSAIVNKFRSKMNSAKTAVSTALTGIKEKFSSIFENAKTIVSNAVDKIKGFFTFEWSLPKPSLPHFNISGGKAPWGFMGEGSLPSISIDWYAKGGVFETPTLFTYGNGNIGGLGENGAEAIVPLEKNLAWLDKLAGMLNDRLGLSQPIVLQVDGKTFAQISVDSINQLTRQRGSIPLNII